MDDQEAGSPEREPEQDESADAPEAEQDEPETEANAQAEEDGEADTDDDGDDEDSIEFDFGGDKVRFAKDAPVAEVAERLREYAKSVTTGANEKFQQAAEVRKSAEAMRESLAELSDLNTEALEAYAATAGLRDRIKQLEQVDVNRMWQVQPDQARRVSDELSRLRNQYAAATGQLDEIQQSLRAKHQEQREKALQAGRERVAKLDPEFIKQADDVVRYVVDAYGIPEEQAKAWPASPEMAVMARKAMLWDRAQKAAKKPPRNQSAEAKPVKAGSGKGSTARTGPSDRDSIEAWMRKRTQQVARKGA